jgi:hypothetical protein
MASFREAQRDIDPRPALSMHYYNNEFSDRFRAQATLSLVG